MKAATAKSVAAKKAAPKRPAKLSRCPICGNAVHEDRPRGPHVALAAPAWHVAEMATHLAAAVETTGRSFLVLDELRSVIRRWEERATNPADYWARAAVEIAAYKDGAGRPADPSLHAENAMRSFEAYFQAPIDRTKAIAQLLLAVSALRKGPGARYTTPIRNVVKATTGRAVADSDVRRFKLAHEERRAAKP